MKYEFETSMQDALNKEQMKDIKTAENYLKEKYSNNNSWSYYPPSERTVCEIMQSYANYLHKAKVESISDEEIEKEFDLSPHNRIHPDRFMEKGAKWFKNKLLNDL